MSLPILCGAGVVLLAILVVVRSRVRARNMNGLRFCTNCLTTAVPVKRGRKFYCKQCGEDEPEAMTHPLARHYYGRRVGDVPFPKHWKIEIPNPPHTSDHSDAPHNRRRTDTPQQ